MRPRLIAALTLIWFGSISRADGFGRRPVLLVARDLSPVERTYFGSVMMSAVRAAPASCTPDEHGYGEPITFDRPQTFAPKEVDLLRGGNFPNHFELRLNCNGIGAHTITVTLLPMKSNAAFVKRVLESRDGYLHFEQDGAVGLWIDSRLPAGWTIPESRVAPVMSVVFLFSRGSTRASAAAARKIDVDAVQMALTADPPAAGEEPCPNTSAQVEPGEETQDPATLDRDEAAVFEAALQHSIEHGALGQVVSLESISFDYDPNGRDATLESARCLLPETLDDFAARARSSATFSKPALAALGFEAVTASDLGELRKPPHGRNFYRNLHNRFPKTNGIASFSQVGFNRSRTQAMLYMAWGRAPLWGFGDVYVLEKKEGRWRITYYSNQWIS